MYENSRMLHSRLSCFLVFHFSLSVLEEVEDNIFHFFIDRGCQVEAGSCLKKERFIVIRCHDEQPHNKITLHVYLHMGVRILLAISSLVTSCTTFLNNCVFVMFPSFSPATLSHPPPASLSSLSASLAHHTATLSSAPSTAPLPNPAETFPSAAAPLP